MTDEELEQGLRELLNAAPEPPGDLVARAVAGLPARRGPSTRLVWLSLGLAGAAVVLALIVFQPRGLVAPTASPDIAHASPTPVALPTPPTGIGGPGDTPPTIAWVRQIGGSSADEGRGLAVGDSNRVFVAGTTSGNLPGHTNASPNGGADGFVMAYELDGDLAWSDQFGTLSPDVATDIVAAGDRVYVAGYTSGQLGQARAGDDDAFVRAYRSDGTLLWTSQFGTSRRDDAFGVAADAGAVYVAGVTAGTFPGQTAAGATDAFLARLGTDGTVAWVRQFGTSADDDGQDVALGAAGIVVGGLTLGSFPGQTSAGVVDAFVRLVDANGSERWTRQFGTSQSEGSTNLGFSGSDIYVGGLTYGTFPGQASSGQTDAYISRLSDAGVSAWVVQFGTSGSDFVYANAADALGTVAVGNRGSLGFAQRISRDGVIFWRTDLSGPTASQGRGIAFAADRIAVGGLVWGAFPGQTSAGSYDVFVALLEPARAPTVAVNQTQVAAGEGGIARASGTFSDANAGDTMTLQATRGTITKSGTGSGTWSWETPIADGPADGGPVTVRATDQTGLSSTVTFNLVADNVPPTAAFEAPGQVDEGSTFRMALTSPTDASAADAAAGFSFAFDCGTGLGQFGSTASVDCPTGAAGQHSVAGVIRDKDGGTTRYDATVTVQETGDRLPPQVSEPISDFPRGKALGTTNVPVRISWTVTDESGITRTELERSTDGGAYAALSLPTTTSRLVTIKLTPGHPYQFRTRATDGAGNVSDWVVGPQFRLSVTQSEDPQITYSVGWTTAPLTGSYGGTSTSSTTNGGTVTYTFTGRALAWIGSRGTPYGRAEVRVDGSLAATVNTRKSILQKHRILFAVVFGSAGTHTVEIRLIEARLVHVDALVVLE